MSRMCKTLTHCRHCGHETTAESAFSRWIRLQPDLDSSKGLCVIDQDFILHKFKTAGNKAIQCMMWIEIKTHGAECSLAQKDTLHIFNQIARNRRQTPTKKNKHQAGDAPLKVFSIWSRGKGLVSLKMYGAHILTFSGSGPEDSEWIKWDKSLIDVEMLKKILCFDVDPDNLRTKDPHRIRHQTDINKTLALPGM